MPRRPNSSRPGCWTCKKRHRRCDESRPVCQKCALHGEECEGYGAQRLAFRNYTASVQRKHGHGLPPPTGPLHGIMLDLALDREDLVVLKEFVESLSHELALTESHNIWRDDIAPLISESDGRERHLLHALLAVTLMYRTHLEHRITYDAAMHYDVAVSDLRATLDAVDSQQPDQLDSVLATLFLLTWFEIFAGDWEKWNIHLIAIANLFRTLEPCQVSQSRFRRRLICALARLDVPNTIWNLNPPLLSWQLYALMLFPDGAYAEDDLEDAAVLAFHRLHVTMAQFAEVYADWLHGSAEASVATHMAAILGELDHWHSNLPLGLQLPDAAEASSPPKTTLQSTLLIHYLSMKLFALHVLNPDCALPHDPAYPFCRGLALKVCTLIESLGSPEKRNFAHFRGDVGVILPLSIVSMFLRADAERAWICDWVRQVKYEGMWCGRRRAMIIEAWAKCERELMSCFGRPLHTMVGEDNIYWKPGEGLNVCIMTYDPVEDRRSTVQIYIDENGPFK